MSNRSRWLKYLQKFSQIIYVVIRDLADGQLTLRAMSLVYTTLLSLVPLLAVSFSVLKGFGVHNQVEPMLLNFLAPLGEQGVEITNRIIEFVNNIKVGVLGSLGLLLLLYTVISLIQKIERAFNFTWNVSQERSFTQRFSDYLSVIFVGPVFLFTAIGITASIASTSMVQKLETIEYLGMLVTYTGKAIPYLLVIIAFTFIYRLIPNTKVKLGSAIVGAIVAGVLWETSGWLFASFLLNTTKYTAIYSAFATLIFFLIWLYLSWAILLIGASIAFYHQNPEYVSEKKVSLKISGLSKEYLAIQLMYEICSRYHHSSKEITFDELVQITSTPSIILSQIINILQENKYIIHTCDEPALYYPAKPLEQIKILDIINHVRMDGRNYHLENKLKPGNPAIENIFQTMNTEMADIMKHKNMLDIVQQTQ